MKCTVAGIYHLRRLQIKRCWRLDPRAVLALDCCTKRGCHEVTGVEKNLRFPSTARFSAIAEGKSSSRGGGFRRRVTWKGGHSPVRKNRTIDGSLFECGWITDLRTFYEDYLKCIEFFEWLKEKAERQ